MVTTIHSSQLKNKIQLETQKQDETCQKIQDPRKRKRQTGREKTHVGKEKKSEEKEQKGVLRKKLLMHHLKVVLILLLKNILSEILHVDAVVNE